MSQWGLWLDELDEVQAIMLTESYIRRTQFEQRMLALAIINTIGESLGDGHASGRIPPEMMIQLMGGFG